MTQDSTWIIDNDGSSSGKAGSGAIQGLMMIIVGAKEAVTVNQAMVLHGTITIMMVVLVVNLVLAEIKEQQLNVQLNRLKNMIERRIKCIKKN